MLFVVEIIKFLQLINILCDIFMVFNYSFSKSSINSNITMSKFLTQLVVYVLRNIADSTTESNKKIFRNKTFYFVLHKVARSFHSKGLCTDNSIISMGHVFVTCLIKVKNVKLGITLSILLWIILLYIWVPKISITRSNFNACSIVGVTIKLTEHTQSWLSIT